MIKNLWPEIWLALLPKEEILDKFSWFNGKQMDISELEKLYDDLVLHKEKMIQYLTDENDFFRLAAFTQLNQIGIISVHNAGSTMSAGFETIDALDYDIRQNVLFKKLDYDLNKLKGYCFYHEQDIEVFVPDLGSQEIPRKTLYLAFGTLVEGTEEENLAIGNEITTRLTEQGLTVNRLQKSHQRIEVLNFK